MKVALCQLGVDLGRVVLANHHPIPTPAMGLSSGAFWELYDLLITPLNVNQTCQNVSMSDCPAIPSSEG